MNITRGKQRRPMRLVVYGTAGIGKSTFAASAPGTIFLPTEDGLDEIECDRFPVAKSYADFEQALGQLCSEDHEYQTLAVDTLDWLERLIHAEVCKRQKKQSFADIGYGNGPKYAMELWKEILQGLDYVREQRSMNIILLAHAKIDKFNDPDGPTYDRYELDLHKDAAAYITEWASAVLFATTRQRIESVGKGFNERNVAKPVGADGGERIMRTVRTPSCNAKNRYGITGEIPLSWDAFIERINQTAN